MRNRTRGENYPEPLEVLRFPRTAFILWGFTSSQNPWSYIVYL
jgi:hypothetical protein